MSYISKIYIDYSNASSFNIKREFIHNNKVLNSIDHCGNLLFKSITKTDISSDISYINIANGWIYYYASDSNNGHDFKKIRMDGTECQLVD